MYFKRYGHMKKTTILLLFIFIPVYFFAQKVSKEYKQLFIEAYTNMQYGSFNQALKLFEEIEKKDLLTPNVQYNIGMCYLNLLGDKSRAIPYLEEAIQNISTNYKEGSYKETKAPQEAIFYLAKAYRINMQLDDAKSTFIKYKETLDPGDVYYHEFVDLQIQTCETAKELIQSPIPLKIENLGPIINDSDDNFNPVITPDGQTMIYTTLQQIHDRTTGQQTFYEIINYTTKENDKWKEPQDITSKINSDGYLATVGISNDGTKMFFFRDDFGDGNLYQAEKKGYRFTEIEELDKSINSKDWESHISFTTDGNTAYFASTRKGGKGGRDIYVIEKNKKGKWNDPVNLGRTINTPYDEDCPVISEDGKTLYFCSEAHKGMGGFDIFYSTKNSMGEWTNPLNIGYPINTTDDDIFFMPFENGKYALFSFSKPDDTYGRKDIYQLQLKFDDGEKPEPDASTDIVAINNKTNNSTAENDNTETIVNNSETETVDNTTSTDTYSEPEEPKRYESFDLRGLIILGDNKGVNTSFNVSVKNTETNAVYGNTQPTPDGTYSLNLPPGEYLITYTGPGYEPLQRSISIPRDYGLPKVTVDVELTPRAVYRGEYVLMRGVLFDNNSAVLDRTAQITLEKLLEVMKQNPHLYVEISGFASPNESNAISKNLPIERANSVVNFLANKGIERTRFITKSMTDSKTQISNNNKNPEAEKYRRRAEINVIKTGETKIAYKEFQVPENLKFGSKGKKLQYTILLTDAKKPLEPSYFSEVERKGVSNVWLFPSANGYFYTIGKYASKAEASELLNRAVDMGFPNARIINFRELERRKQLGQYATKLKLEKAHQANGEYTIQLLALKVPVEVGYFKNVEGVERIKGTDGIYRYIWGRFDHKTAIKKRDQLKRMGHANSFVMSIDFYKK
jgi:outer membrane protein OmpA-like peptidoglycan-associated protein/tetratricopeptide (TPR) repeat protein